MDGISTLTESQWYVEYYRCNVLMSNLQILYKRVVDMFGSQNPPSYRSILITVSARHGPDRVDEIKYSIPLRGIKPDNMKINIIRSLDNSRNG